METGLVVLPQEVTVLAEKVASEKREEVNTLLNQLFSGTENWKQQIAAINVKDHTDTMAMSIADTARLSVKKARLEAEKLFDAKRDEVQRLKSEFDLEDKLWLKSKQIMQEMFKSMEQELEYKANTAKRYEIEQKEKRTQERLEKVVVFNPTVSRFDVENLSDEMFNIFLAGIEKEHNDRIEAEQKAEADRIENERIFEQRRSRELILLQIDGVKRNNNMTFTLENKENPDFSNIIDVKSILDCDDVKFKSYLDEFICTAECNVEYENKMKAENERLKAEAEAKQKEIDAANAKAQKEREEAALKIKQEQEKAAEEKAKLEAQLRAKKEAEERAENEKRIAEAKAQKEADKLAKAPVKKQLDVWVNSFSIQNAPIENEVSKLIAEKFAAFKNWSLQQIENL